MPYMRHAGMLRVLFGLDVGTWSGSLPVLPIYETGCLVKDVHCKRLKENGKLIEFCGRSNKAGLFEVIAEYFGGTRRGCIMIPASSNHAG